ncbi:MAG TPA: hypothetical protein VEB18_01160 [Candidatus Paceibacterota bacterium]|nr:hypothetical protein [Candidatus Paceibacterota bacterium]
MSADTRIVIIKQVAGGAFAGVLQATECLVDDEQTARAHYARHHIDHAFETLPDGPVIGLVRYASFEAALEAIPQIEEWYNRSGYIEYENPLVVEWNGEDVRKLSPTSYS